MSSKPEISAGHPSISSTQSLVNQRCISRRPILIPRYSFREIKNLKFVSSFFCLTINSSVGNATIAIQVQAICIFVIVDIATIAIQVQAIFVLIDVKICQAKLLAHLCIPRKPREEILIEDVRSRTTNDMAAVTNISQNADKGFVNAVFHRCTVCLELRYSDQVEFLTV